MDNLNVYNCEDILNNVELFDNFITKEECEKFIDEIKNKRKKNEFTISSSAETDKYIDFDLSAYFFKKYQEKTELKDSKIIGHNKLIMTSFYRPNTMFGIHTDTGLYYDQKRKIKSTHTLLIYLNDNFEGGHTIFYDSKFKKVLDIEPKEGRCVVFPVDIFHEGLMVLEGEKCWIGCELISTF